MEPLLHLDNEVWVIKQISKSFAAVSQNQETHKKIIKAGALLSIFKLINKNIHFEITKYCIKTVSNLAENLDNILMSDKKKK